ncbi:hypothetical protein OESDEN_13393 [Oesophagostomum dentatum]|uniref:DUF155 domain-containing protein n=1 Tax=Oesophagostomum dentatum TaxID=61180 RepID=A0A0B1SNC7_OESDE|nr:hypothetical protein OESDEN_13393 [Oesophagostomum dentatum]
MALSESLDLESILIDKSITNMFNVSYVDEEFDDTIHLVKKLEYSINPAQINEIFVFQDGVVVFWNVDHAQRAHTIRDLERYMEGAYESSITMEEQDTMPYSLVESDDVLIKHDCFMLSAAKHGADHRNYDNVLERFSLSQAFAASVKVGVWETLLNNLAEPLSETTKALKQGVVPWNRKEALRKSGDDDVLIKHDCFMLSAAKHGADHRNYDNVLERFSLSQAFAASVKVGVWETLLNNLAEPLSETTKALKQGVVPWNRKEALRKSGEFAALRHSINLDCTLLNRDFYWDHSQVEDIYVMSARHFILSRRISSLNRRLDYCEELVKMVDNILALRHVCYFIVVTSFIIMLLTHCSRSRGWAYLRYAEYQK